MAMTMDAHSYAQKEVLLVLLTVLIYDMCVSAFNHGKATYITNEVTYYWQVAEQ